MSSAKEENVVKPPQKPVIRNTFIFADIRWAFSDDLFLLMQNKHWGYFSLYLVLSIVLGILLVLLGRSIVKPA